MCYARRVIPRLLGGGQGVFVVGGSAIFNIWNWSISKLSSLSIEKEISSEKVCIHNIGFAQRELI